MKRDIFIDWYKRRVERILSDPEPDILNNLKDQLDIDDIWGKIEDTLDVDHVWENISDVIHPTPPGLKITWEGSIKVFTTFLLIIIAVLMPSDSVITDRSSVVNSEGLATHELNSATISPVIQSDIIFKDEKTITLSENRNAQVLNSNNTERVTTSALTPKRLEGPEFRGLIIDGPGNEHVSDFPSEEIKRDPLVKAIRDSSVTGIRAPYIRFPEPSFREIKMGWNVSHSYDTRRSSLIFGSSLHAKNVWIINNELYRGLDPDELLTIVPVIKMDAGLLMGKPINSQLDALVAFNLFSKSSQKYKDYMNGYYKSNELELNYFTISFMIKHRYRPNWFKEYSPVSWTSLGGVYFSNLNSVQLINGKEKSHPHNYLDVDFGLIWGHEVELALGSRMAIAPGFRFYFGLPDISGDGLKSKAGFPQERNASVDFTFSVYFLK